MNSYYRAFVKKNQPDYYTIIVKTDNLSAGSSSNNQFTFTGGVGDFRVIATPIDNVVGQNQTGPKIGFGNLSNAATITFPAIGLYELKIIPIGTALTRFRRIEFNSVGDRLKLLQIKKWGNVVWSMMGRSYFGCSNLNVTATDTPILTTLNLSFVSLFQNCSSLIYNETINNWNTAIVNNMSSCFQGCTLFNQPLSNWNTSNVTRLDSMFFEAHAFNQDLQTQVVTNSIGTYTAWDVRNVTRVDSMFRRSLLFNGNINNWNTSNINDMSSMFRLQMGFNQDISTKVVTVGSETYIAWNTSNVTRMPFMFRGSVTPGIFNANIGNWNTSNVTSMQEMFDSQGNFNQNINTKVVTVGSLEYTAWDVSKVTNMNRVFTSTTNFNQPLNNWNTSLVTDMSQMFRSSAFNQPIDTNQVTVGLDTYTAWNVSNVQSMSNMFSLNGVFNQPLNNWNVINVLDMSSMFLVANSFNQPLDNWDVSNVQNMESMFNSTEVFMQNLGMWNFASVTNMSSFLMNKIYNPQLLSNIYNAIVSSNNINMNVPFAANSTFNASGAAARATLINDYNWTIQDNGPV